MFICFYSKFEVLSNIVYLNNIMYFGMCFRLELIGGIYGLWYSLWIKYNRKYYKVDVWWSWNIRLKGKL